MCLWDHHRESVSWGRHVWIKAPGQCDWTRQPLFESAPIFYICKYKNTNQDLGDLKVGSENPQEVELQWLTKPLAWHLVLTVLTGLMEKRLRVCRLKGQHSSNWEQIVSCIWKLPATVFEIRQGSHTSLPSFLGRADGSLLSTGEFLHSNV